VQLHCRVANCVRDYVPCVIPHRTIVLTIQPCRRGLRSGAFESRRQGYRAAGLQGFKEMAAFGRCGARAGVPPGRYPAGGPTCSTRVLGRWPSRARNCRAETMAAQTLICWGEANHRAMVRVSADSFHCCYRFQPENNQCPNTTWKPSKTVRLAM
jgi:hypothetical protein